MSGFCFVVLFCFKQKTAYEMRISDWSSDVCSSDLKKCANAGGCPAMAERPVQRLGIAGIKFALFGLFRSPQWLEKIGGHQRREKSGDDQRKQQGDCDSQAALAKELPGLAWHYGNRGKYRTNSGRGSPHRKERGRATGRDRGG